MMPFCQCGERTFTQANESKFHADPRSRDFQQDSLFARPPPKAPIFGAIAHVKGGSPYEAL